MLPVNRPLFGPTGGSLSSSGLGSPRPEPANPSKTIRSSLLLLLLAAASVVLLGVGRAHAWGKTWLGRDLEWQYRNAAFTLGPFGVDARLVLSNAGFDSNVYYGATDEPVRDYTFTMGPAFDIYLPVKKTLILHIHESPQYVYFKETARERTWNNYFRGEAHLVFNRLVATAGVGREEAKQRWNTEIDIPIFRREDSARASLFLQAASKTSFNLGFRTARYDYGEADFDGFSYADKLNRDETYFQFTAYREISSRTRFFLEAEYGVFEFLNPSLLKNSTSLSGYGGFEFSPFGRVRGRVKIGYKSFDSASHQRKDYRGLVGDSSISVRLAKPFAIRASYRRDVQFSVWYDNTYYLESRAGAGASLYVSRNIRLDYDFSRGRNDYPREFEAPKRLDVYTVHAVGVYFRLRRDVALGIIASRWMRDSNLDWEDDDRDFVGFNLTYDF